MIHSLTPEMDRNCYRKVQQRSKLPSPRSPSLRHISNGNNFCSFLYASLDTENIPKECLYFLKREILFKVFWYNSIPSTIFSKGGNFLDFMYASLDTENSPKDGSSPKELTSIEK